MREGPRPGAVNDQYRIPKPKNPKEIPHYLKTLILTFFTRLFYIMQLIWETKKSLLFILLGMSLFNGIMPVLGSIISAQILNRLAEASSGEALAFSVVSVLLIYQFIYMFTVSAVSRIYNMIISTSGELVANHVRMKIMYKAREVDLVSYDSPDFYAKLENANREAGMRPLQIMSSSFSVLSAIISITGYVIVLFSVSSLAPLLIVLVSIPSAVINFIYRSKNVNYMFRRSKNRRQMDYYSSTIVNKDLVKEVRMFDLGPTFCDRYSKAFGEYFKGLKKLYRQECLWSVGATVLTNIVYCLMFIFLAKGVFSGTYAVGSFSLYTGAITAIGSGVSTLITTTASIYEGTLFINNLISFLAEKPGITPSLTPARHVARHTEHTITFEDVCFRYPGSEQNVINHVSLSIRAGETVVIVGLNGAGKTTLVKLLTRLYDPSSGRILLDGHDLKEYDVQELYDMFGIIFQDFGKYAVSAGDNIAFGDLSRNADKNDIVDAACRSGADGFIQKLPNSYDTPLMRYFEENGAELSIGQWQKLAIARAFYSNSDILILDEPTASLDPMAEQDIFNHFNELRRDKTSIFISHRLSSATIADKVIVMENGQIEEIGTHHDLMQAHGRYCELFTTQAARYLDAEEAPSTASVPV